MKRFILDSLIKSVVWLGLVIAFAILGVLWINMEPMLTTGVPVGSQTYNQIIGLGNHFFLTGTDSVLVFFYFILVAAMFMSALALGGSPMALAVGLVLGILSVVVSMPISDVAHTILYTPALVPATSYYKGSLYILDNLPIITALEILGYLIFSSVVAEKVRTSLGLSSAQGGGGGRYFHS